MASQLSWQKNVLYCIDYDVGDKIIQNAIETKYVN